MCFVYKIQYNLCTQLGNHIALKDGFLMMRPHELNSCKKFVVMEFLLWLVHAYAISAMLESIVKQVSITIE